MTALPYPDMFPALPDGPEAAPLNDFTKLGRCWNCYAKLVDGACPTKGCRCVGSGFEKPREWPEEPCRNCGELTRRHVLIAVWGTGTRSVFGGEVMPYCKACGERRAQEQAQRMGAHER